MITEPQRDLPSGIRGGSDIFDDLLILQSEFFTSDTTVAGNLKRWNGSSWVNADLRRWNGAAWEVVQLKRYNGTAWVNI